MRNWWGVAALAVGAWGCSARGSSGVPESLAGSLEVQVVADTVWLGLHVTNVGEIPLELVFASAQQFEFVVRGSGGDEVWRWSEGRSFGQAESRLRLAAGETWQERVRWLATGRSGGHEVVGRLLAGARSVELTAEFEVGRE